MTKRIYIAGPMTGLLEWNFPAFDEAGKRMKDQGFEVVNPVDFDRARGFDEKSAKEFSNEELREAMAAELVGWDRLDLPYARNEMPDKGLADCTDLLLLPGWESSKGAFAEASVALWLGMSVWVDDGGMLKDMAPISQLDTLICKRLTYVADRMEEVSGTFADTDQLDAQSILDEAQSVLAERGKDYGDFGDTLKRVARVWSDLVGEDEWADKSFRPTICARFMLAIKMVRERQGYKHDNWVDALNYAVGGDEVGKEVVA